MFYGVYRVAGPLVALVLTCSVAGCMGNLGAENWYSTSDQPARLPADVIENAPLARDVVAVLATYNIVPWLRFDLADPKPQGFKISSLYLISTRTGKGVFGDGLITVRMFRIARDQSRQQRSTLMHTWEFTPAKATPYRSVRRTMIGYGYHLRLRWPEDCDVAGWEISVIVEFLRRDGKLISSDTKYLRVPLTVTG